jgi:hypothetical protein
MSYYTSSHTCSAWTLEERTTPADISSATEQGDETEHALSLQEPLGFISGYGGQYFLEASIGSTGLRSPTSTSLTAVGGQFSDEQSAGQTGSSMILTPDPQIEGNISIPTDPGIPVCGVATHYFFDQFSGSGYLKRRRDSSCQPERSHKTSRRTSLVATPVSIELSSGSTSTMNTGYSGRRRGPLTAEQRQNAKSVRERGACWRCHSLNAKVNFPSGSSALVANKETHSAITESPVASA